MKKVKTWGKWSLCSIFFTAKVQESFSITWALYIFRESYAYNSSYIHVIYMNYRTRTNHFIQFTTSELNEVNFRGKWSGSRVLFLELPMRKSLMKMTLIILDINIFFKYYHWSLIMKALTLFRMGLFGTANG